LGLEGREVRKMLEDVPMAPASRRASACVRPRPLAAPETSTTLPFRLNSGRDILCTVDQLNPGIRVCTIDLDSRKPRHHAESKKKKSSKQQAMQVELEQPAVVYYLN
jgi:hypothetical protein